MKQEINISSSARKGGTERSLRRVALDLFCFLFSFSLAFGLAVALAFLLTGCSDPLQEDDSESEGVNRTAIEFTTSVPPLTTGRGAPMGSTRGTPITSPTALTSMGVFCYHTGFSSWATVGTNTAPNKMNHLQFTQNTPNVWSTASPVSWGADVSIAEKFTFWAYAPYATGTGASGNGLTLNAPAGGKGFPTLTYTVPTDITKQPDLMVATSKDIHPTTGKVPLAYKHALTCIAFKAKGSGQKITGVKVKGVAASGTLSVDAAGNPVWGSLSNPGTIEYTAGLNAAEITTGATLVDILNADGYLMMIPQTLTANAELIVTMDGEEYTFKLHTQDINTWTAGQLLTYGIDADAIDVGVITDYTQKSTTSNCYIINPSTEETLVYKIPVKRLNEFWASPGNVYGENNTAYSLEAGDAWSVSLLWATSSALVKTGTPTDAISISKASGIGPDDHFELTVPAGMATSNRGNFTVSIYVNSRIVWNWHFWVTDYNPYSKGTAVSVATEDNEPWVWEVDGGRLLRFSKSTDLLYKGKRFMDRAVGYIEGEMPMLYQYGRMNPFPNPLKDGVNHTFNLSYLYRYTSSVSITKPYIGVSRPASVATAIGQPTYLYSTNGYQDDPWSSDQTPIGPFDWCYTASSLKKNIYWNDPAAVLGTGKKSLFDPSPYGFRVPERGAFYSLSKVGNSTYNSTTNLFYTTRSSDYTATIYPLGGFGYMGAIKKDSGRYYYYINGSPYYEISLIGGAAVGVSNSYWTSECYQQDYDDGAYGLYSDRTPAGFGLAKRGLALPVLCMEE